MTYNIKRWNHLNTLASKFYTKHAEFDGKRDLKREQIQSKIQTLGVHTYRVWRPELRRVDVAVSQRTDR